MCFRKYILNTKNHIKLYLLLSLYFSKLNLAFFSLYPKCPYLIANKGEYS